MADTTKTLTIRVAGRHIREARRRRCNRCPIALAIVSAGAIRGRVQVSSINAWGLIKDGCYGYCIWSEELPRRAARFIFRFDHGQPVKPFAFRLRLPVAVLKRKGAKRWGS